MARQQAQRSKDNGPDLAVEQPTKFDHQSESGQTDRAYDSAECICNFGRTCRQNSDFDAHFKQRRKGVLTIRNEAVPHLLKLAAQSLRPMATNLRIIIITITVLTAGCQNRNQNSPATSPTTTPAASTNNVTDKWLGQWNGPEGTYLLLSKSGDQYVVKIQSLDGPATYEGVAAGDRIEFKRDGKTESIRAGSGKETGMKWLLEKKDCLIINEGEGFCRK
jgi:hypothetical protein